VNGIIERFKSSKFGKCLAILEARDRRKIYVMTAAQVSLGALDLLGVAAIGLLGTMLVTGVTSDNQFTQILNSLGLSQLSNLSYTNQIYFVGIIAAILLISRTLLSIFFTKRILLFLSRRGAKVSSTLVTRLLSQPLLLIQTRTTQETLYFVTRGVEFIVLQILPLSVILVSDLSLLLIMTLGLVIIDPVTAFGSVLIFTGIGFVLFRFMHVKAEELGIKNSELNVHSNEKIVEVFTSYREAIVRNRRDFYAREIEKLRYRLAGVSAEAAFMPHVSKYVIETSVVLGAFLIGAIQFVFQDTTQAVASLAIYLAAGTRLAPAILRLQQGSIQIRTAMGQALPTLGLIEELGDSELSKNFDDHIDTKHTGFESKIRISNLTVAYPNSSGPAVSSVNLDFPPGKSVAIVGPSGAGKTTLIDALLGILPPTIGLITISGLAPLEVFGKWPGAISYVPQDVNIIGGTIRENVALGYPRESATDDLVKDALQIACLDTFLNTLPLGLETPVGERGAKMSGGQRQRLGIARALFTKPKLLVLDEATSSLDGETEASITEAILKLKGTTTVIMIAHRLSTVRNADMVVYLSEGNVVAHGSFEEVRAKVPDFDYQAKLMGL
jgi:ABC-type multidrug transport system fused ATPase/permease subunit